MGAKKSGGGKLSRSETVSVRLDPKLRFAAELAARRHRRTLSSFVEWAVEEAVNKINVAHLSDDVPPETAFDVMSRVWDVDEADRFAKLAMSFPMLLTHDEDKLWKLICECGYFWKGAYNKRKWSWTVSMKSLVFDRLRERWWLLNKIVNGEADKSDLPKIPDESYDDSPF